MRVMVMFMGPLAGYVGQKAVQFDLPQGAIYGDLLDEIGRRFGAKFPERIWDNKANVFKPGILIVGEERDLESRETPLVEGEEIKVVPLAAGGNIAHCRE